MEPTRIEGLARLAAFLPRAGRAYRATRNEDRGPADRSNVSVLGPYIRARLITEEEVLRAVLQSHSRAGAEKFVQEVFWRTYWKGWLEARPAVWRDYRRALDDAYERLQSEAALADTYGAAVAGRTEVPAFNAWSSELVETGYLHNHARMWFASIWIFTLRLPWELGADFFMRHLLCGDPASNTLSWRWVAGLHTRGKAYRAGADNIRRYTAGRLDPGTQLATRIEAIVGPTYDPEPLPPPPQGPGLAESAVLLLHDDDAGVETLPLQGIRVAASLGLLAARGRSPRAVSEGAFAFARGAVADALQRAGESDDRPILTCEDPSMAADAIAERARARRSDLVITPYAPVGPVRDALDALEPLLAARDVRLRRVQRAFDAYAWPHATRGFYHLRSKIPAILQAVGIGDGASVLDQEARDGAAIQVAGGSKADDFASA